jgi:two-component system nitrogen regulation response regulator NtrX
MGNSKGTILLVDDEEKLLAKLSNILESNHYRVISTTDGSRVIPAIESRPIDAIILDLIMPDYNGISILKEVTLRNSGLPVIILSGHGTIAKAVEATKLGAYDFLEKPIESQKILITLENALKKSKLEKERSFLIQDALKHYRMIGISSAMKQVFELIEKAAPTDSRVLISGESGTGKELIARAIHLKSERAGEPFIVLNCAAIPDELIESELFGHEKGSFTGAINRQKGKFELASEGTLFLDEIGEMSQKIQPKVLRAIENSEIQPIGCQKPIKVNVRLIAATNRDLQEAVKLKEFRQDLYFRLSVINVYVPSLRERKDDIPHLVNYFIEQLSRERKRPLIEISSAAMEILMQHDWPGNIRELRNLIEKIMVLSNANSISAKEMGEFLTDTRMGSGVSPQNPRGTTLSKIRKKTEREAILASLSVNQWNYEKSAWELGISRATLFNKIKELNIKR